MTKKTGNFKKFMTFVKMLGTALSHASSSVFVELLTFSDLELLRLRKGQQAGSPSAAAAASTAAGVKPNNKRYLILTYAVEFDKYAFVSLP